MKCRNRGGYSVFLWFKGCSLYRSTKGFRGLHLLHDLKKAFSSALTLTSKQVERTLKSKPFEVPVVVAVGRAFVLIAPGSDLYDLRTVQSTLLP